jgi:hypothetical protein
MECPYCEQELRCHDYYGTGIPTKEGFKKVGDIYKCDNELCGAYQENFYTDQQDNLYEGYPC